MILEQAADLDGAAVLAVAAGEPLEVSAALLEAVAVRRDAVLSALGGGPGDGPGDGAEVYGVTTGMGALSDVRLTPLEQADHSRRLLLARAVGGPPWLSEEEGRTLVAVRLRTFLGLDAGVSAELCAHLVDLLSGRPDEHALPPVPRTGSGAAGEILPLAHAWGHLALPDPPVVLGPKEGIALLAGVPTATALALLRARDSSHAARWSETVAAGSVVAAQVSRDPYDSAVARGDDVLAEVLARVRDWAGPATAPPRHLQAPVSFRVVGPVLAHLDREATRLAATAERALSAVTDSPAYLLDATGAGRFVGTAGFHGLDLAAGMDALRAAVVHAAAVSAARLHRLLDPGVTGLPAQLSVDPGPQAGLTPVHKRVVAEVHAVSGWPASTASPMETSAGQEDVQTFALEAAERLRLALGALQVAVAAELLAVHQARLLDPARLTGAAPRLLDLLDRAAAVLPDGADDRPRGPDLTALVGLLGREGPDGRAGIPGRPGNPAPDG